MGFADLISLQNIKILAGKSALEGSINLILPSEIKG